MRSGHARPIPKRSASTAAAVVRQIRSTPQALARASVSVARCSLTGGRHVDKVPEVAERFVRPRVHRHEDGVVGSRQCRDTSDRHDRLDGHLEELVERWRPDPLDPVWSDMHLDDEGETWVVQWRQLMATK